MKISASKIEQTPLRKRGQKANSPAFGASLRAQRELTEQFKKASPRFLRTLISLGQNDGETMNTLVTGIGTAFVAPIFIAFNPFSKADKETRTYSAWRQPISAVLAVAAQLFVNNKFNRMLDNLAVTGQLKPLKIDLSSCPTNAYLRKLIKTEHPDWTKGQVEAEIINRQSIAINKAVKNARANSPETAYDYKELVLKTDKDKATELVMENCKTKLKSMSKKDKKKFLKEIKENIEKESIRIAKERIEDKEKAKYIIRQYKEKNKSLQSIDNAINHATEQLSMTTSKKQAKVWNDIINKLKMSKGIDNNTSSITPSFFNRLKSIFTNNKTTQTPLEIAIDQSIKNSEKAKGDVATLWKDIVDKLKTYQKDNKIISSLDDAIVDAQANLHKAGQNNRTKALWENIILRLENCKEYETSQGMKAFSSIADMGKNTLEEVSQRVRIKEFVLKSIETSQSNLKNVRKWGGLIVAMATLPVSCGLLNWTYPRLMEKIMPEASKKRKEKEMAANIGDKK